MVEKFDIPQINKAAATFDPDKLKWVNEHYIKTGTPGTVSQHLQAQFERMGVDPNAGPALEAVVDALRERAKTLEEMACSARFLFEEPQGYDEKAARKHFNVEALRPLSEVKKRLEELRQWNDEAIHGAVTAVAETLDVKMGMVAQPLRVAVSGSAATPPIDVTLRLVGRERTLSRIDRALEHIEKSSS